MAAIFNHSNFTKPFKWLIFSLCLKLLFYFLYMYPDTSGGRHWFGCFLQSADHDEYVRPMDNYFERGVYALDGQKTPYAGRLPGFVFPYMIFRAVFNETTSAVLLGIFILSLSILSSYILSLLMFRLTQKRWAFTSSFFLLNCIPFFWHYDWTLHTNSLAVSCSIFFLYYLNKYQAEPKNNFLIKAGFFLGWMAMLRGFTLVFIPLAVLYLTYIVFKKTGLKQSFKASVLFIFPFLLFEGAWITRNYIALHELIPFQTSFVPGSSSKNPEYDTRIITKHSMMKVRKLIFAWGGDNTWYFNNADMAWFVKQNDPLIANFKFDDRIFFEGFNIDSLIKLKSTIIFSLENTLDKKTQDSVEALIENTANRYYENFSAHKKGYMYFVAPFRRLNNYLFKNVTQDWPGPKYRDSTVFQKGFKLLSLMEYALLLICVLLFPLAYLKSKNNLHKGYIAFIYILVLANILPFMGLINFSHYSYFIFGYTMLIPIMLYIIDCFIQPAEKNG